ncbi:MAG: hypothetical protein D6706_21090 [Chloroflexi bacterium]|nr:MAG: hypothetical protein D6706_21090 [Chloroflexota bacterium]
MFFVMVWLVGCQQTAVSPITPTPVIFAGVPEPTSDTPETAVPPPATPLPPSATPSPTATPRPTQTATPQPTNTSPPTTQPANSPTIQPTNTTSASTAESMPPASASPSPSPLPPSGTVEQPPYEPSPCSDKYPCNDDIAGWEARIRVPAGFQATYFARVNGRPTSITFGPDALLYVAVQEGTIYTINSSGHIAAYVSGFNTPTGIAFQPGTNRLYVASRVRDQNTGGEAQVSVVQGGSISQIIGGIPCCYAFLHAANGIAFGPDGFGYVAVGARADHGEILEGPNKGEQDQLHPWEATILRFSPGGSIVEPYAYGFRNAYDIAWDANGVLWATDNAPDFGPPEELHRVVPGGQHGYPWYECDICFAPPPDVQVLPPTYMFVPHSAPTGITAYLADQFPGYYNNLFVTLWSAFPGAQKVVRVGPGGLSNFATGFAAPIDVTVGPDGSLYVADWATGIIFRIAYTG